MSSSANQLEEAALAAYREFTSFGEPQLKKIQDLFTIAGVKDYEKRKWMFERHFCHSCPKLTQRLSAPNHQVQFEIEAIVRRKFQSSIHPTEYDAKNYPQSR